MTNFKKALGIKCVKTDEVEPAVAVCSIEDPPASLDDAVVPAPGVEEQEEQPVNLASADAEPKSSTPAPDSNKHQSRTKFKPVPTSVSVMVVLLCMLCVHKIAFYAGALAQQLHSNGFAMLLYNASICTNPFDAESYVAKAKLYLNHGDRQKAATIASTAIRLNPNSSSAYLTRAKAKIGLWDEHEGRFADATDDIDKAVSLGGTTGETYAVLGDTQLWRGDCLGAQNSYEMAIKNGYRNADIYNNLAQICRTNGQNEEALGYLSVAIALDPTSYNFQERAKQRLELGNSRGAIEDARRVLSMRAAEKSAPLSANGFDGSPGLIDADMYKVEAQAAQQLGRTDLQMDASKEALKLTPDDSELYQLRYDAEINKQMDAEALQDLNQMLHLNGGELNRPILYTRALLKAKLLDAEGMERDLSLARALWGPDSAHESEVRASLRKAPQHGSTNS